MYEPGKRYYMFWRCCLGHPRCPGQGQESQAHSLEQCYFSQTCKKCNTTASSEQHWACKPWSCMGARLQQWHRGWAKNQFGTFSPNSWLKTHILGSQGGCVYEIRLKALLGQNWVFSSHVFLCLWLCYTEKLNDKTPTPGYSSLRCLTLDIC